MKGNAMLPNEKICFLLKQSKNEFIEKKIRIYKSNRNLNVAIILFQFF